MKILWLFSLLSILFLVQSSCSIPLLTPGKIHTNPSATAHVTRERTTPSPFYGDSPTTSDLISACGGTIQKIPLRETEVISADDIQACYEIRYVLSTGNEFWGTEKVTFINHKGAPLSDLVFRTYANSREIYGGELVIQSVRMGNLVLPTEQLLHDGTAYRIALPKSLSPSEITVIEIDFSGKTPIDFNPGSGYGVYNFDEDRQVITLANSYPILAEWDDNQWQYLPVIGQGDAVVSDTSLYHVFLQVPGSLQVASTGQFVSREKSGGQENIEIVSGLARDFMLIAGPDMQHSSTSVDDFHINLWGSASPAWSEGLKIAADSMALYNDLFGYYPFKELDIVSLRLRYASGVEYPGLIIIEEDLFEDPTATFFRIVIAHEVAHQWWYSIVGNDVLQEPWLDESLTTYSSMLYIESINPVNFRETMSYYRSLVNSFEKRNGTIPIGLPVSNYLSIEGAYSTLVYLKGSLMVHDIRERIGDLAFFSSLRSYYHDYAYDIAAPEKLLELFERDCHCDLSDIYSAYGVP